MIFIIKDPVTYHKKDMLQGFLISYFICFLIRSGNLIDPETTFYHKETNSTFYELYGLTAYEYGQDRQCRIMCKHIC